jgi:hypothetical protein
MISLPNRWWAGGSSRRVPYSADRADTPWPLTTNLAPAEDGSSRRLATTGNTLMLKSPDIVRVLALVLIALSSSGCEFLPKGSSGPAQPPASNGLTPVTLYHAAGCPDPCFTYHGDTGDPLAASSKPHAVITAAEGASNPMTIWHTDRQGKVSAPWNLSTNVSYDVFNGQEVEGSWTAQFNGPASDLPASVGLTLEWKAP